MVHVYGKSLLYLCSRRGGGGGGGGGKLVRISSDGYDRRSIYGFEIFDSWIFLLRKLISYVFRY